MSELNKKYQNYMSLLEKTIKDSDQLNLLKSELTELMITFVDVMDRVITVEERQTRIEEILENVQRQIDNIEEDFYVEDEDDEYSNGDQMHDNDYEFEIICPYCGNGFVADNSFKYIKEIKCPECKEVIELDWNGEDSCYEDCSKCKSHCYNESSDVKDEMKIAEDSIDYTPEQSQKTQKNNTGKKESKADSSDKGKNKENKNSNENKSNTNENEDDM